MKVVKKSQANIFKNSDRCIVWEYQLNSKELNGAVIKIEERYPDKGNVMNEVCKEIAYVVEGSGKVVVNDSAEEITTGDSIFIDNNEKFHWEGDLLLYTVCSPAYYPEQHKEVVM